MMTNMTWDSTQELDNGLIKVEKDGKCGVVDKSGNLIVPVEYTKIKVLDDEFMWVNQGGRKNSDVDNGLNDGKYGVMNKSGELVIPLQYNGIEKLDGGFFKVQLGGEWAYDALERLPICFDAKLGVIDTSGKLIIPIEYDDIENFDEGRFRVNLGAIQKYRRVATDSGVGLVREGGKWGVMDLSGNLVLPIEYHYVYKRAGVCLVRKDLGSEHFKLIKAGAMDDTLSHYIIPLEYSYIDAEKLASGELIFYVIDKGSKQGVVNIHNELIVPMKYRVIYSGFKIGDDRLFVVHNSGGYGLFSQKKQELVVPMEYSEFKRLKYDYLDSMGIGLIAANKKERGYFWIADKYISLGEWGVLDTSGNTLIPPEYYFLEECDKGLFVVNLGGTLNEDLARKINKDKKAIIGGKWGVINLENTPVIPIIYDSISYDTETQIITAEQHLDDTIKTTRFDKTGVELSKE